MILCKVVLNLAFCGGGQLYRLIPYYLIEQKAAYREQQHDGCREHDKQDYYHGVHNSAPLGYSVGSNKLHYTGTKTKKQYNFNIKIKSICIIIWKFYKKSQPAGKKHIFRKNSVITLATGSVLPAIYEGAGLNRSVALSLGYDGSNVYDVLYNHDYFVRISSVLVIASVVGAVLNVIPFFFYDFTEVKQKAIVKVLKIRALFEDYGNNVLADDALVETVDIIKEAEEYSGREMNVLSKDRIKQAKKSGDKALVKAAKKEYNLKAQENEKIEISRFVLAELDRFNTPEGMEDLEIAKKISAAGLSGFMSAIELKKSDVKRMPKATAQQKERRKDMLRLVGDIKTARKTAAKYYPNGIEPFDSSVFEGLFKREDEAEVNMKRVTDSMKLAKESKDKAAIAELRAELRQVRAEKQRVQLEIKKATDENSLYYRAAKPYLDAVRTIAQSENYSRCEDIFALYDGAKERIAQRESAEAAV